MFEAAAAAMAIFRQQGWAATALTANAKLRVEVPLPTVVHDVPVAAVERWLRSPNASPKEAVLKKQFGSGSNRSHAHNSKSNSRAE